MLASYASQVLPVSFAGLALIGLGIALMASEACMPGCGGIAFVIGSIILVDTEAQGFGVSIALMVGLGVVNAAVVISVLTFALKARRRPVVSRVEEMIGLVGEITAAGSNKT